MSPDEDCWGVGSLGGGSCEGSLDGILADNASAAAFRLLMFVCICDTTALIAAWSDDADASSSCVFSEEIVTDWFRTISRSFCSAVVSIASKD